jgi:hypothetical protein
MREHELLVALAVEHEVAAEAQARPRDHRAAVALAGVGAEALRTISPRSTLTASVLPR